MDYSDEVKQFLKKDEKHPKLEIALKMKTLGRAELFDAILLFLLMATLILFGVFFQIQGWDISNVFVALGTIGAVLFGVAFFITEIVRAYQVRDLADCNGSFASAWSLMKKHIFIQILPIRNDGVSVVVAAYSLSIYSDMENYLIDGVARELHKSRLKEKRGIENGLLSAPKIIYRLVISLLAIGLVALAVIINKPIVCSIGLYILAFGFIGTFMDRIRFISFYFSSSKSLKEYKE